MTSPAAAVLIRPLKPLSHVSMICSGRYIRDGFVMPSESAQQAQIQIVVFHLEREFYAIPIALVWEIIRHQPITRLPGAPAFVEGVLNLRGSVIPVIDLRKRFGLPSIAVTGETRIVVAEMMREKVGLIVDAVSEVMRLSPQDIESPESFAGMIAAEFIQGVGKAGERLIVLLALDGLLDWEEKTALTEVRAEATSTKLEAAA